MQNFFLADIDSNGNKNRRLFLLILYNLYFLLIFQVSYSEAIDGTLIIYTSFEDVQYDHLPLRDGQKDLGQKLYEAGHVQCVKGGKISDSIFNLAQSSKKTQINTQKVSL